MADELCFSSTTTNNNKNPPLIFYDLSLLCSFIFSHPLYFSYFLFFSPYFIKFISLFSPLFFTTTLLFLLSVLATSFPHSNKLGLIQTVLDKFRSKLNHVDEEEEEQEFCNFEEFEIYKIVFRDVPSSLITVGDGDRIIEVAGEAEEETKLERLFEELDRFEDSMAAIEMKKKETSSDLVEVAVGLQKLGGKSMAVATETTTTFSGEDQKTVPTLKSNSRRLDSCSSFGSYGSMKETTTTTTISGVDQKIIPNSKSKSKPEAVEMKKLGGKSMAVATETTTFSGEDQKTVPNSKSNSCKEKETSSDLVEVVVGLQKPEAVDMEMKIEKLGGKSMAVATISGEDPKTVPNSKSNSRRLDSCSSFGSYGSMKKETTATTVSSEDQKTVPNSNSNSWRLDSCSSFGSYGSMRKEKEWKRTLACKLFEERHNNSEGGEEGMDSLWEAYETDHSAMVKHKKKKTLTKNKSEFKCFDDVDDDEDDDDDEFMRHRQLCCLKALKLSAGKMNLGMGKPNLVKISKALKGFGWLHHVGTKNGKRM